MRRKASKTDRFEDADLPSELYDIFLKEKDDPEWQQVAKSDGVTMHRFIEFIAFTNSKF